MQRFLLALVPRPIHYHLVTTGQKLKAWLEGQRITQVAFVKCMKDKDPSVSLDQADVSKWVNGKRAPNEHQKIVIQAITGIPTTEWLPDDLRKLAESLPPSSEGEGCDED